MSGSRTPSTTASGTDPGGQTIQRYRYQICYTAFRALDLTEAFPEINAIYCEHYDDLIAENSDGKFLSVQIKTRGYTQDLVRATDSDMVQTIATFTRLDKLFPGQFERFEIVTNHQFNEKSKSASKFPYLIQQVKNIDPSKPISKNSTVEKHFETIRKKYNIQQHDYISVMQRVHLRPFEHSIELLESFLFDRISEIIGSQNTVSTVEKCAGTLMELVTNKSSSGQKPIHIKAQKFGIDFEDALEQADIESKRITFADLAPIISYTPQKNISTSFATSGLSTDPLNDFKSVQLLIDKMKDGEVESERIALTRSYVYSIQRLYIEWQKLYGSETAYKMFDDVLTSVRHLSLEAKINARRKQNPYGSEMYTLLFKWLDHEAKNYGTYYQGCKSPHLMGFAGYLTNKCEVPWSDKFDMFLKP